MNTNELWSDSSKPVFSCAVKNKTALQMKAVVKQRFCAARCGAYLCKQCWLPCIVKRM